MKKVSLIVGVIAVFGLMTSGLFAADVAVDLKGSRLAAGYTSDESGVPTFGVPEAKLKFNAKLDEGTKAVARLSVNNAALAADYLYVEMSDVLGKIMGGTAPINTSMRVGSMKINFGEETWSNNPVEGALVNNSLANVSGYDEGVQLDAMDIVKNLPLSLNVSLAFLNGCTGVGVENNTNKAYNLKVSSELKSQPLYFSLSYYSANDTLNNGAALKVMGDTGGVATNWDRKAFELNVRYDLLEGAKFEPTKAPLFAKSKGVFRLAYGQITDGEELVGKITHGYVMLDGLYNINAKWYAAFRYSYDDIAVDRASALDGKPTRTQVGAGCHVSENTTLKLDYTMNAEADTTASPKIDNNVVSVLLTTIW
jgi:hypothetical protein